MNRHVSQRRIGNKACVPGTREATSVNFREGESTRS